MSEPDSTPATPRRRRPWVLGVVIAIGLAIVPAFLLPSLATFFSLPPVVVGTVAAAMLILAGFAQSIARPRDRRAPKGQQPPWWLFGSLPLATEQERRLRWRLRVCLGVVGAAVVAMATGIAAFHTPAIALGGVPLIWLSVMVMLAMTTKLSGAHFAAIQSLRRSGYRVCPGCTYDLASMPPGPGVCPECGRPFDDASLKERWEEVYEVLQKKPGP
ncbi:MAG: hypothetical protein WC718_02275 [Phycisphaerales bacterium]|jgi:hypothetical protein